ncbi:class F sortase [Micromonospora sp. M12]
MALLGVTGLGLITVGLTADPTRPPDRASTRRDAPTRTGPGATAARRAGPGADTRHRRTRRDRPGRRGRRRVLEVPPLDRPTLAGWYRHGVSPGETGNAVLVGHVDAPSGPAVFFDLGRLRTGQQIHVTRADARDATFTVDDVRAYPKEHFPTALVYGPADVAGLRLITCGGRFDATTGNYVDNVVVFATRTA